MRDKFRQPEGNITARFNTNVTLFAKIRARTSFIADARALDRISEAISVELHSLGAMSENSSCSI